MLDILINAMQWVYLPEAWIALGTLILLETVLGIDNVVFISILADKLPPELRDKARRIGLGLAMFIRVGLLFAISWIMGLTETLFTVLQNEISGRDLILLFGGAFLILKAAHEIYMAVEGQEHKSGTVAQATFGIILLQIVLLDVVFSLDSVITAVGLVDNISIMIIAVIVSVIIMMIAAKPIGDFVSAHPSIKILALAFLVLIGFVLVVEGLGYHIPKGIIYGSMAIAFVMDMLDIRRKNKKQNLGTCSECGQTLKQHKH